MNSNIEKDLKLMNLSSIYLLYGKETFLLENTIKKIKKSFGELKEGLNYIKIDSTNVEMLISEMQTPPFGFEKKLIVVKGSELFKKQSKKNNQTIIDITKKITTYIEQNIDDIAEQNLIIFVEEDAEKNELYKLIEKIRYCVLF